jgi:hypothetical protein
MLEIKAATSYLPGCDVNILWKSENSTHYLPILQELFTELFLQTAPISLRMYTCFCTTYGTKKHLNLSKVPFCGQADTAPERKKG